MRTSVQLTRAPAHVDQDQAAGGTDAIRIEPVPVVGRSSATSRFCLSISERCPALAQRQLLDLAGSGGGQRTETSSSGT